MLYDLTNILDKERFKRRTNELYQRGVVVDMREKKPRRSLPQNAYLHLILGWYAMETGNTIEYVKQSYFKRLCNEELFCCTKQDQYLGEVMELRSTKELDTAEMTHCIERFRNWSSATCGIYLPSPDEQAFLQGIEIEMRKQSDYL